MGAQRACGVDYQMNFAIGLDLGGAYIKGCLISQSGEVLEKEKILTGARDFLSICDKISNLANSLINRRKEIDRNNIAGMGIGSPGGIYNDRGTISQSPNFPLWKDVNIKEALVERGFENVMVENDANAAAFGEYTAGAGREFDDMALFTLGTGVGGGLILDKKIWRGAFGMAGELGHITVCPDGPFCGCGNRGCLETYANIEAVINAAKGLLAQDRAPVLNKRVDNDPEKISPKIVYEAAKNGDMDCVGIFREIGGYLGIAIADILNILNMPLFIIGGGISGAFEFIEPAAYEEVNRRAFREPGGKVKILPSILGNESGFLGAAYLALREFGR